MTHETAPVDVAVPRVHVSFVTAGSCAGRRRVALAAIWFWTIAMMPIVLVLIGGVVISQVRAMAPAPA